MGFMTQKMVESGMAARGFDVASGFDALTLKDYARWGLRDFNRFLPKCVLASLPLVEDQQDYDLPEACMTIAVVYYTPVRSDVTISRPSTFYYPSETYFWDAQFANFIAANRANYTVYDQGDGQLLRLFQYLRQIRCQSLHLLPTSTRLLAQ